MLLAVLVLFALLTFLILDRSPSTARSAAPSADEVRSAKGLYDRVRLAQVSPGPQTIRTSWTQLAAVVALGGRTAGVDRVELTPVENGAVVKASRPLALGFWLNGQLRARADPSGHLTLSARIGDLPVPSFVVRAVVDLARKALRLRGADIPPLDAMVLEVHTDDEGVTARVDLPGGTGAFVGLSDLVSGRIDDERVASHYCRLVDAQRAEPSTRFTDHVHRAFAQGDGTAEDNRALFVSLSLLVAQIDAKAIADGQGLLERCGIIKEAPLLQGRDDLAKHWAVSAALASAFGTDTSLSVGVLKEISDSGDGGSGFSLVDLTADRSGVFSARRGADPVSATALRDWLRQVSEAELVPVAALAFAEGMTEQEFRSRFTDTDSAAFAAAVERIDARLTVLMQ